LNSHQLRVFLAVVDNGSYSAAARTLGYTQPAISQQMRGLERKVGTVLFTRVGRRMRLTEAGEVLARNATHILANLQAAEDQVAAIADLRAGRVRLAAFPSASATLVPQTVARVTRRSPGLRVSLVDAEPPQSLPLLRRGECDVALAFSYGDADPEGVEDLLEYPLMDDPLHLLLPASHPKAEQPSLGVADLSDERWIAGCPVCRRHLLHVCEGAGFEPDIVCATDDNLAVQSLVAAGVGVALMPDLVVSFIQHPQIVSRPPSPQIQRRVAAYTLPGLQNVPAVATVLRSLTEAASELGPHPTVPRRS
jgi:DNA-binding transcriptional LysR family regulator